jgi:ribonucleoside-diphosphate reductase alpha chain
MGDSVPDWVQYLFITSHDVTPEWHVRMQAAFQRHTDNAVSKTINFPSEASIEDISESYMLAFRERCKGITIYRDGSKDNQVLSPGQGQQTAVEAAPAATQPLMPRPRPQDMEGRTERIRTGHGNMYITINFDNEGSPFEVFSQLGKAGGCDSAQLEAISRLVSLSLRSGIDPEAVMEQLRGITCCPAWDRGVLVRSAPDAVALSLEHALSQGPPREAVQLKLAGSRDVEAAWAGLPESNDNGALTQGASAHGNTPNERNRCPDCNGPLAFQEGCLLCSSCGWNRCGS